MLKFFKRKKNDNSDNKPNQDEDDSSLDIEDSSDEPSSPQQAPEPDLTSTQPQAAQSDDKTHYGQLPDDESDEHKVLADAVDQPKGSFFSRLKSTLSKTRKQLSSGLADLFLGKKVIDEDLLEEIETALIMADVGVDATDEIIEHLTRGITRKQLNDPQAVMEALKKELLAILTPCEVPLSVEGKQGPMVILMIGVNGSGKTTTIGKLAKRFQKDGKNVMLAAGDTFRAAAIEQLQVWGLRNDVQVISQHTGADSASVVYDAYQAAQSRGVDVLIADTAGRLHTSDNLMEELKKIKRVLKKINKDAPHEVMLVIDASLGQNALVQAQKFHEWMEVTGLVITKLDGTAKGGILFAIAKSLGLPIRFIGCGERIDDLAPFQGEQFIDALFSQEGNSNQGDSV